MDTRKNQLKVSEGLSPAISPTIPSEGEESSLMDVPINEFKGATLEIAHDSTVTSPGSRPVTPSMQALGAGGRRNSAPEEGWSYWKSQGAMFSFSEIDPTGFFALRDGAVEKAVLDCHTLIMDNLDGELKDAWLLTEIDHWDKEKERLVLLCEWTLLIVKYDFIGLRKLMLQRIPLKQLDKIVMGELKYPEFSLVPRITGIADGVVSVVKGCIWNKLQDAWNNYSPTSKSATNQNLNNVIVTSCLDHENNRRRTSTSSATLRTALTSFKPSRARKTIGVRGMWNRGKPARFTQQWNPFSSEIPWVTYTSHPLLITHQGEKGRIYDVEQFGKCLIESIQDIQERPDSMTPVPCVVEYSPIMIDSYLGIASLIHNANNLGFYKHRGNLSF